jgi:hypothetical protein
LYFGSKEREWNEWGRRRVCKEREKKVKRLNVLWETVESSCYVTNDTIMPVSRDPTAMVSFVYLGKVTGRSHPKY